MKQIVKVFTPACVRRIFTKTLLQIKVFDRDKTRKGKTEDENLGEVRACTPFAFFACGCSNYDCVYVNIWRQAKFDMDALMQAPDRRLNLKNRRVCSPEFVSFVIEINAECLVLCLAQVFCIIPLQCSRLNHHNGRADVRYCIIHVCSLQCFTPTCRRSQPRSDV
jgi:hypothetical protein